MEIELDKFKGIEIGKGQIDLRPFPAAYELRPIQIFHKEDGDVKDEPSFAILMVDPNKIANPVIGQLSLRMLNQGLADVGYEIVKKKK